MAEPEVWIERLTWPDVEARIAAGARRVIICAASMVRAGRVLVAEARGVHLLGLAASSDGREIYAVAGDRLLRLDAATGKLESSLALTIDPSAILGVRAV